MCSCYHKNSPLLHSHSFITHQGETGDKTIMMLSCTKKNHMNITGLGPSKNIPLYFYKCLTKIWPGIQKLHWALAGREQRSGRLVYCPWGRTLLGSVVRLLQGRLQLLGRLFQIQMQFSFVWGCAKRSHFTLITVSNYALLHTCACWSGARRGGRWRGEGRRRRVRRGRRR